MTAREAYAAYTSSLDGLYAEAAQLLSDYIASFDWNVGFERAKAQRNLVAEFAHGLVETYGDAAATLASDFYVEAAIAEGVAVAEPALAEAAGIDQVGASIRNAARPLWGGERDAESFRANALASLQRYIKKSATSTLEGAARRDGRGGARWARVPRGAETCAFCIILASRGFVYYSEQSADLFGHEHEHCDCDVIPSFSDAGLEGYDSGKYLAMYEASTAYDRHGHVDQAQTYRNLRNLVNAEHADAINAKRRRWYARNAGGERERVRKWREENASRAG